VSVALAKGAAALFLTGIASWPAAPAMAQQGEQPKPPPKSVEVQAFVILASKGEVDYADPSLKELAELLRSQFKDQFNRFRLHKVPHEEVRLDKTAYLSLVENYHLKVTYTGVEAEQPEKVRLSLAIVRRVQEVVGGKVETRETTFVAFKISIVRDKFFLMTGPQVGDEKVILAVRVLK